MLFEDHRQRSDYDSYKNSEDGDIFFTNAAKVARGL